MVRLKPWQWVVLGLPIASIVSFLLIAAGIQIQQWGISWIWAIVVVMFVLWRWLLVEWTRPALAQVEAIVAEVTEDLEATTPLTSGTAIQAEAEIQTLIETARTDPPFWEDWGTFWQRCQTLVATIAHVYHPQVKHPLLNIYVPQAYGLIRGTTDDLDRWIQKLSPALNQVTIGQAYQAYEMYQKVEPSAPEGASGVELGPMVPESGGGDRSDCDPEIEQPSDPAASCESGSANARNSATKPGPPGDRALQQHHFSRFGTAHAHPARVAQS